jgi:hypothetical protein
LANRVRRERALVAELRQRKYRSVLRAYPAITRFEARATSSWNTSRKWL